MAVSTGDLDWLARIAKRAKVSEDEVKAALAAERIVASPAPGKPRRLILRRLKFNGVKIGIENAGPFAFDWDYLEHGLYAIVTKRNFRGKSSIIEIIRWLLKGRPSNLLQSDVVDWIHAAELTFALDDDIYTIRIAKQDGLSGSLIWLNNDDETLIVDFSSPNDFEFAMSEFFLNELSLEEMTVWTKVAGAEREKAVVHGWPALAGVLYIGTDYASVLGDVPVTAGLSPRLLQMFLGLPWVSTATMVKAALAGVQEEQRAGNRKDEQRENDRRGRRELIENELRAKREDRAALPAATDITERYKFNIESISRLNKDRGNEQSRLDEDRHGIAEAKQAYDSDRRDLRAYQDSVAAGAIFRRIEPSRCPRCETSVDEERKQREAEECRCFLCGEAVESEAGADEYEADLKTARDASKSAYNAAKQQEELTLLRLEGINERYSDLVAVFGKLDEEATAASGARILDLEIAVLEGQLKEIVFVPEEAVPELPEISILTAILRETEELMKERQGELLSAVSEKMLDYAKRFGIENLNSLRLKGNLHLEIHKGGSRTNYGDATPGEKLRLKVAAVLALISVGAEAGIGRHPGILLIDSLAAQEINLQDLEQLVTGLEEIASELTHLQIFVASLASEAIAKHVPVERLRAAQGDDYLW